jgi:hypothetical protein
LSSGKKGERRQKTYLLGLLAELVSDLDWSFLPEEGSEIQLLTRCIFIIQMKEKV